PRDLAPGDLVLWQDATPPPAELKLPDDEEALPIPLSAIGHVPTKLLHVGDSIAFLVPRVQAKAGSLNLDESGFQHLGPFRIVSIGGRLSRQAPSLVRESEEPVITVAIQLNRDGKTLDEKTNRLLAALRSGRDGTPIAAIVLHPSPRLQTP